MYIVTVVEKTLPRAIIGVWNKKNRCFIKRLPSEKLSYASVVELIRFLRPVV